MTSRAYSLATATALSMMVALTLAGTASAADDFRVVNRHGDPMPRLQRIIERWDVPLPEGTVTVTRRGHCKGRLPGKDRTISIGASNDYGVVGCVTTDNPREIKWWDRSRQTLAHELGHVWDLTRADEHRRLHWRARREYMAAISTDASRITQWFGVSQWGQRIPGAEHLGDGYAYCATGVNTTFAPASLLDRGCDVIDRPIGSWRR